MRSRVAAYVVVPLVACAWPLLLPRSPQDQGGDAQEVPEEIRESVRRRGAALELQAARRDGVIGEEARSRQDPFLLARPDGRALLGALRWTPGQGDHVVLCDATTEKSRTAVVNAAPAEIIRPVGVVDAQGRVNAFWTELVGEGPQLRCAREEGGSADGGDSSASGLGAFTAPVTLTSGALPNMNVEAALHADGRLWVAWETESPAPAGAGAFARGSRDVYVAPLGAEGRLGARVRVGDGPFSDLDPVIASAGGKLWIAWVAYCGRDYEIRLRSLDPDGTLSDVIEVSADSASDDLHPGMVAAADGSLWIAWDHVEMPMRGDSFELPHWSDPQREQLEVSVRVACVRDGRVLLPKSARASVPDGMVPGAPLLSTGGGLPRLCFDGDGRLWIAYRYLARTGPMKAHEGFPVLVQRLDGDGFTAPIEIEQSAGMPDEPAIARAPGDAHGVQVAFECDRRFDFMTRRERLHVPDVVDEPLLGAGVRVIRWYGSPGIGLATTTAATTAAVAPLLVDRVPNIATPHFHPYANRLDDPLVTGARHFEIARERAAAGGAPETWQVFWGDLHRHSSVSRCSRGMEPLPSDRWEWGRDVHLYDFMALTDHSGQLQPSAWWQLDKLCWLYQSPTFCTLAGWEWSTVEFGHHNVILPGRMTPLIGDDETITGLYKGLKAGQCVTIPHHSSDTNFPNDFSVVDDRFTRLIEVYQSRRGNFEFDGCYKQSPAAGTLGSFAQDALNQGHKFGIIASSDHGYGQSYACVLAKTLDRASLFDALLQRRTYGATAKGMLIDLRIDGALMGEEVTCAAAAIAPAGPKVALHVVGAAELADLVVFRDGRIWKSLRAADAGVATELAPMRLVVTLPTGGAAPAAPWSITVQAPTVHFEKLDDRRRLAQDRSAPSWTFRSNEATLTWPAGFAPAAGTSSYPLHAHAAADAPLTLVTPAGATAVTFGALLAAPIAIAAPGGPCTVSIEANDAVIDLKKGLGTATFTGEWDDPDLQPGASWYYARMVQVDGEMAWSSPVFVTRK